MMYANLVELSKKIFDNVLFDFRLGLGSYFSLHKLVLLPLSFKRIILRLPAYYHSLDWRALKIESPLQIN